MNLHPTGYAVTPALFETSEKSLYETTYHLPPNTPVCEVTYVASLDVKVSYVPSVFINNVYISQAMNLHR